jgi:hypothetical protein
MSAERHPRTGKKQSHSREVGSILLCFFSTNREGCSPRPAPSLNTSGSSSAGQQEGLGADLCCETGSALWVRARTAAKSPVFTSPPGLSVMRITVATPITTYVFRGILAVLVHELGEKVLAHRGAHNTIVDLIEIKGGVGQRHCAQATPKARKMA